MKALPLLAFFAVSAIQGAKAIPRPEVRVPKISGTVVSFTWIGGFSHQQERVWVSGPTGLREASPCYFFRLKATNLAKDVRDTLTSYSENKNFSPKICQSFLADDELIVFIPSNRFNEVAEGSKIEITDFRIQADEYTSWSSFGELLVNGGRPTRAAQPRNEEEKRNPSGNSKAEQSTEAD